MADDDSNLDQIIDDYQTLVRFYRTKPRDMSAIKKQNIKITTSPFLDPDDNSYEADLSLFTKFANLLLAHPLVYLNLLVAYVQLTTFPNVSDNTVKMTEAVKKLFRPDLYTEDKITKITNGDNNFIAQDNTINLVETTREAKTVYMLYVTNWFKLGPAKNSPAPITMLTGQIGSLVDIMNQVLGNDIGTRALKACKDAVYTDSALKLTTYVGCKNNFFSTEKQAQLCPQGAFEDLKNDLLQAVGLQL